MKTFYLVVPGEPVGKARPRVTPRTEIEITWEGDE